MKDEGVLKELEAAGTRSGTTKSKFVIEDCGEVKPVVPQA